MLVKGHSIERIALAIGGSDGSAVPIHCAIRHRDRHLRHRLGLLNDRLWRFLRWLTPTSHYRGRQQKTTDSSKITHNDARCKRKEYSVRMLQP
jgi:hypothetical protein